MRVASMWCITLAAAGCFRPDVDALTEKLRDECRIAPTGPRCALEDPEASNALYERWVLEEIDTPAEEECLLALDCAGDDDPMGDAHRCTTQDDFTLFDGPARSPDDECVIACRNGYVDCGGDQACGVAVLEECTATHDACPAACPNG